MRTYYASSGYNWSDYSFQGFIYNPHITPTPPPPPPTPTANVKKHNFPWFIYSNRWRRFGR